jgi:hypothetical protein
MSKFGDTPNHAGDKCASCARLIEIKGHSERETVRKCSAIEADRIPARVTACTLYHKRTDNSLTMMMNMAWVLTLDQKKRTVGFTPPKKQPSWVTDVEEMNTGEDDE